MSESYIPIENHFTLQGGFAFPSSSFVENGIPIVRMSDLKNGRLKFGNTKYVSHTWLKTSNSFSLNEGDFLLGMSGSLSNYAVVSSGDIPAFLNQRVGRLQSKDDKQSYEYVCYWLKSIFYHRYAEIQGEGAAQKNVSSKQIGLFQYRTISLVNQYKIAKILQTIDRTITHTEALIEKYQQIKAGLMHDLFTRGIGADGKLRPPRDKAPELYRESSIGWIPKEWNYAQLKHYVRSAQYGISTSLGDAQTGIPVLRMNNIKSNIFDVCDLKYTNDSEAYKIKLKKGDVLYNRTNSMEHVGKIAIWRNELPECSFASYLVRINLHENIILPDFFSHWMSQISSQNALRRYATPAVQQVNINPTNLQKIWISCPHSIEEQRQISERIDMVDLKLKAEKTALDKLRSKKSGLMHDLLTGTVRVNIDPV